MTDELIPMSDAEKVQALVLQGNLGALTKDQQVIYIQMLCSQYGLDWKTKPFDFITAQGKTFCYANRNCFDQLRSKYKISLNIVERVMTEQVFYVRAVATMPDGRVDESLGAVGIAGLKGEYLANAMMKAETKAKRRVTQSITAMSMSDETEVETIPEVKQELQGPRRLNPIPNPEVGAVRVIQAEIMSDTKVAEAVATQPQEANPAPTGGSPRPRAVARRLPPAVAPIGVKVD